MPAPKKSFTGGRIKTADSEKASRYYGSGVHSPMKIDRARYNIMKDGLTEDVISQLESRGLNLRDILHMNNRKLVGEIKRLKINGDIASLFEHSGDESMVRTKGYVNRAIASLITHMKMYIRNKYGKNPGQN